MHGQRAQRRVSNVANDATTFIGRSRELREIRELLGRTRLLTLTGAGGVGKTRLAKAAVASLYRSFADGARFIDLSQAFEEDAIVQLVRDAAPGVRDASTLVGQLSSAELLLVLDNCEHLVDEVSTIESQILAWCPSVTIINTTRLPLGIAGEHIMLVAPLGTTTNRVGQASESAILFIDRARAVTGRVIGESNIAAVNELCVRLEGLPLAIELAAIKARVMTVPEITAGLDDRFGLLAGGPRDSPVRHHSLNAMLQWSWEHCSADERILWARFSVFAGPVPMDAIASICALSEPSQTTRVVDGLVQQSLLAVEETHEGIHFRMLDTIREFGRNALISNSDGTTELAAIRQRHLQYYADLVSAISTSWFSHTQHKWSRLAASTIANLRVAFEYALEDPENFAVADSLFSGLWLFWVSARLAEGRAWADKLHRQSRHHNHILTTGSLWTYGWISLLSGDIALARTLLTEAAVRASTDKDLQGAYLSKGLLAACAAIDADLDFAAEQYDEVVEAAEQDGDPMGLAVVLQNRAEIRCLSGDYASARADCVLAETICQDNGDEWLLLYVLWVRTLINYSQRDFAAARESAIRALRLRTATENQHGVALVAETLAWTLSQQGEALLAAVFLGSTERYWTATGFTLMGVSSLINCRKQCMAELADALGPVELQRHLTRGAAQDVTALPQMVDKIEGVSTSEEDGTAQHVATAASRSPAMESTALSELTDRQYEIAQLLAQGLTNKEIAAALVIGRRTVDTHVGHILARLGVARRAEVAALVGFNQHSDSSRSTPAGN